MRGRRFHTVDVFAPERYAGNQLAVFHDAADLAVDEMQALTRETNYSEATFIVDADPGDGRYPVRIFDPAEEIPFAGHPTIGTAAVIREFVRDDTPDELVLALGVGDVTVWVETATDGTERYWMRQIPPTFGDTVEAEPSAEASASEPTDGERTGSELERDTAARVLGLDPEDVLADAPIQLVSTGLPTLVVPLTSLDAAERAATQPGPYERELLDVVGGCNLLVVTGGTVTDDADLHVRVFADWADVPEDPATGSSNGCLAAYLARYDDVARRLGLDVPADGHARADASDTVDAVVEQGLEMGRPSRLHLRANQREAIAEATDEATGGESVHGTVGPTDDAVDAGSDASEPGGDSDPSVEPRIDVRVGGRVIPVGEGKLL